MLLKNREVGWGGKQLGKVRLPETHNFFRPKFLRNMYDNVIESELWCLHSATHCSMIFKIVQKIIENSNCIHIMIACAPIQYTVIFRALKIAKLAK